MSSSFASCQQALRCVDECVRQGKEKNCFETCNVTSAVDADDACATARTRCDVVGHTKPHYACLTGGAQVPQRCFGTMMGNKARSID